MDPNVRILFEFLLKFDDLIKDFGKENFSQKIDEINIQYQQLVVCRLPGLNQHSFPLKKNVGKNELNEIYVELSKQIINPLEFHQQEVSERSKAILLSQQFKSQFRENFSKLSQNYFPMVARNNLLDAIQLIITLVSDHQKILLTQIIPKLKSTKKHLDLNEKAQIKSILQPYVDIIDPIHSPSSQSESDVVFSPDLRRFEEVYSKLKVNDIFLLMTVPEIHPILDDILTKCGIFQFVVSSGKICIVGEQSFEIFGKQFAQLWSEQQSRQQQSRQLQSNIQKTADELLGILNYSRGINFPIHED